MKYTKEQYFVMCKAKSISFARWSELMNKHSLKLQVMPKLYRGVFSCNGSKMHNFSYLLGDSL